MENNSILQKLDGLEARFEEVSTLITDPDVIADQNRFVKLTKEYKDLGDIMDARKRYIACLNSIKEAKDILANEDDPFVKGVQLVYDTLLKSLKEHGAEPFDSVGKDLDTEKMEAIATLPSPDVPEGKVSIESKKGWMLKDKVLRVAQVVVSSGKPGGEK